MFEEAVWGLLPLSLFLLGGVMLWYASWRQQRRSDSNPFARQPVLLTAAGWGSLFLGILGVVVTSALVFSPFILVAGVVVIVFGVIRYWRSESRYLVWALAEAAQRGIPLERVARAFAVERAGITAQKARRLADYLDAAMPLSLAMARSNLWVLSDVMLAADIGEKTGALGPSLRKSIQDSHVFDNAFGAILATLFYLSCAVLFMVLIVTFIMLKIVPTFEQMFLEFGLTLPAATVLLISFSHFLVNYWFVLVPLVAGVAITTLIGALLFVGVPIHTLPIVRYFFASIDNVTVLHSLATAVQQRQPILDNLLLLSGFARSSRSRHQLGMAITQIEAGTHWTDAIEHSGLISKTQNGVIQAAERTGNLAWALDEMADSTIRRTAQRAQAVLSFVFPACLIGFGICVFFVAVGMMLPLFSLISSLS